VGVTDLLPLLRRTAATVVLALGVAATLTAPSAGAQDSPTTVPPLRPPTTLEADSPTLQGSDCGPGNIVRPAYCGEEPESKDDPGGWLQVSLFFIVCAVVVGIGGFVWWRSRVIRRERRAAGLDPEDVARRSGAGLRPGEAPDRGTGRD
jgi:hypothetical protein